MVTIKTNPADEKNTKNKKKKKTKKNKKSIERQQQTITRFSVNQCRKVIQKGKQTYVHTYI